MSDLIDSAKMLLHNADKILNKCDNSSLQLNRVAKQNDVPIEAHSQTVNPEDLSLSLASVDTSPMNHNLNL